MQRPTREAIEEGLRSAAAAHHEYETNALRGVRDEQWPGWYAAFLIGRFGSFAKPTELATWLAEAPVSEDWLSSAARHVEANME